MTPGEHGVQVGLAYQGAFCQTYAPSGAHWSVLDPWLEALTKEFSAPLLLTTPPIHLHINFEQIKYSSFFSPFGLCFILKKDFLYEKLQKVIFFFLLMHITISGYERQVYIKLWSADDYLMYIVNTDDRSLGPWDCLTRQMDGNKLKYASFSFPQERPSGQRVSIQTNLYY